MDKAVGAVPFGFCLFYYYYLSNNNNNNNRSLSRKVFIIINLIFNDCCIDGYYSKVTNTNTMMPLGNVSFVVSLYVYETRKNIFFCTIAAILFVKLVKLNFKSVTKLWFE